VNRVLELVPTAIDLLDRLRGQADRIRQLGTELAVNISSLRSQIDVARDQANLVSIRQYFLFTFTAFVRFCLFVILSAN